MIYNNYLERHLTSFFAGLRLAFLMKPTTRHWRWKRKVVKVDVVICSNNSAVVEIVSRGLQQDGGRYMVCESGLEVLGLIGVVHCDLLVLDVETPGLSNLLLISAIRELAPALPILAVSTRDGVDARALSEKGVPYRRLDSDVSTDGPALLAEMNRLGSEEASCARRPGI